jgi:hypothetical protein
MEALSIGEDICMLDGGTCALRKLALGNCTGASVPTGATSIPARLDIPVPSFKEQTFL